MTDEILEPDKKTTAPRASRAKTTTEELPRDIVSIIPRIRQELGVIAKDQQATAGASYSFRGHDQIVNAIAPLFDRYGVFTTVEDESVYYGGRNAGSKYATASVIRKRVTFHAPDGSNVSSVVVAESVDYGNKATTQSQTVAYRVALTQTFTIPTGEPDTEVNNEPLEPTTAPVPAQPQSATATPEAIAEIRAEIKELFAARGVTDKEEIQAKGTAFFNGRVGWEDAVPALKKLAKALRDGEVVGE